MVKVITLDKNMKEVEHKEISQASMSSECWTIQIWGIERCNECPLLNDDDCGGKEIRKSGKNSNGLTIPLNQIRE